jgi:hypothetical protein
MDWHACWTEICAHIDWPLISHEQGLIVFGAFRLSCGEFTRLCLGPWRNNAVEACGIHAVLYHHAGIHYQNMAKI